RLRSRDRAASERQLHGLLHAARRDAPRPPGRRARDAEQGEPAGGQGRRRIRLHGVDPGGRQRDNERAGAARHRTHRHAPHIEQGVGGDTRREKGEELMYALNYVKAKSVKEAADFLSKNPEAKLLSGGMTLIPTL